MDIHCFFQIIGAIFVFSKLIKWLEILYHSYINKALKLRILGKSKQKKANEYPWAAITGATEGIGKGFCIELAKLNFNILVFARNQE